MKILMTATRHVAHLPELQSGRVYAIDDALAVQLCGQGVAMPYIDFADGPKPVTHVVLNVDGLDMPDRAGG